MNKKAQIDDGLKTAIMIVLIMLISAVIFLSIKELLSRGFQG